MNLCDYTQEEVRIIVAEKDAEIERLKAQGLRVTELYGAAVETLVERDKLITELCDAHQCQECGRKDAIIAAQQIHCEGQSAEIARLKLLRSSAQGRPHDESY
jgi:ribosomal protein L44E